MMLWSASMSSPTLLMRCPSLLMRSSFSLTRFPRLLTSSVSPSGLGADRSVVPGEGCLGRLALHGGRAIDG